MMHACHHLHGASTHRRSSARLFRMVSQFHRPRLVKVRKENLPQGGYNLVMFHSLFAMAFREQQLNELFVMLVYVVVADATCNKLGSSPPRKVQRCSTHFFDFLVMRPVVVWRQCRCCYCCMYCGQLLVCVCSMFVLVSFI